MWWKPNKYPGNDQVLSSDDCPVPEDDKVESLENWCTITPSLEHTDTAAAIVFHAADYYPSQVPTRKLLLPQL